MAYLGGKAWWGVVCEGVGLVGALCPADVCRKARVVGVGWSAWHPTALSLLHEASFCMRLPPA